MAVYHAWFTDQELPGIPFEVKDQNDAIVDYSSGWSSFTAKLVRGSTLVASQTTGVTGAATSPNITIASWTSATLALIAADLVTLGATSQNYELRVYARRTSDSADEVPTSSRALTVQFKTAA
jgi:hypothetical protein